MNVSLSSLSELSVAYRAPVQTGPSYDTNDVEALRLRIRELEDAIEPLLPYAKCDNYKLEGMFLKSPEGQRKFEEFQRATIYMDLGVFQRLDHLMKDRIDGA